MTDNVPLSVSVGVHAGWLDDDILVCNIRIGSLSDPCTVRVCLSRPVLYDPVFSELQ